MRIKKKISMGGGGEARSIQVSFERKFRCLATKHIMFAPYENKFLRY